MKDEILNLKQRQTSNREDKCGEEEEGKLMEEFEAQASVFL